MPGTRSAVALLLTLSLTATAIAALPRVIYGIDDRHEIFEETNPEIRRIAESTAALVKTSELGPESDGQTEIRAKTFGAAFHLCQDERFREQETPAFCSGFLIAPDTLVTAGHCLGDALSCSEVSFVFGYGYRTADQKIDHVSTKDIYRCAKLVYSQAPSKGADFAIVKLDRPVTDREPLRLRAQGSPAKGDDLVVIGHPSGLPTKIANGAQVRDASPDGYFTANLDTYGGNSGSAVFNAQTFEVEGVLVRGEVDFRMRPEGCMTSNVCESDGCRGEDVTRISNVLQHSSLNF